MPRIVIHAGPGKTGTSAIQLWLNEHRDELQAEGVYYPAHEADPNGISSGNVKRVLERPSGRDAVVVPRLVSELLAEFQTTGCHTLLLSAEPFFSVLPELDATFPNAEFIVYLRDPLEMFESKYNQSVKRHGCRVQLQVPPRIPLGQFGSLRRYRKKRPGLRLHVRAYLEESFVEGSLVADFLFAIGSNLRAGDTRRVNSSYSLVALEFMRIANNFPLGELRPALDVLLQRVAPASEPYSLIPEGRHADLQEQVLQEVTDLIADLDLANLRDLPDLMRNRPGPLFVQQVTSQQDLRKLVREMKQDSPELVSRLSAMVEKNQHIQVTNSTFFDALEVPNRAAITEADLLARVEARELAELIVKNDDWQAADVAREFSKFLKQQGDVGLALNTMKAALELRPGGLAIQRLCDSYQKELEEPS